MWFMIVESCSVRRVIVLCSVRFCVFVFSSCVDVVVCVV